MSVKSFRYDFTMEELKYYFFSKKNCPKCGSKMKKNKGYKIVDGKIFNTQSVPLYIQGREEVKYYHYLFNCPKCNSQYTLKQLVEIKNNKMIF